jgi:hypothetical protein
MGRWLSIAVLCLAAGLLGGCSTAAGPEDVPPEQKPPKPLKPLPEVPDVVDLDGADAISELETEGFDSVSLEPDPYTDGAGCTVLDQTPAGGEQVDQETDVTLTLDCRQVNWENLEGDDWQAFIDNYSQGFGDGCTALFNIAGEPLYDDDPYENDYVTEYYVFDCTGLEGDPEDVPIDVPDDPAGEGYSQGFDSGCQALFDDAIGLTLFTSDGSEVYPYECRYHGGGAGAAVPGE